VPIWQAQVAFRMEMGLVMLEHISHLAQIVDRWGTIIQTVHSEFSPVPKLSDETLLQCHLLQVTLVFCFFFFVGYPVNWLFLDPCSCSYLDMSSSLSFASFLALGKYAFS